MAYILAGIGFGTALLPEAALFVTGYDVLELGQVFYIAWAIWVGVTLRRSKAAAPASTVSHAS